MNDQQKEQLKQDLIDLMQSVGNGTFKPAPLSKTFLAKLYVKRFLRYLTRRYKLRKAKRELQEACQDVINAQIESMQKGLEFLEALPMYAPENE